MLLFGTCLLTPGIKFTILLSWLWCGVNLDIDLAFKFFEQDLKARYVSE